MALRSIKIPMLQSDERNQPASISLDFLSGVQPHQGGHAQLTSTQFNIVWASLAIREYLSTLAFFLLLSRLGGDIFIAGPVVTLYVNIFFRRPLINPLVTTLACWSKGDWKRANVSGMPRFETPDWTRDLRYWGMLVGAQLAGAATAAIARSDHTTYMGQEFIRNSAWGIRAMHLQPGSCWNTTADLHIRDTTHLKEDCHRRIQGAWWFTEDCFAALFFTVAYVHIWRWLRWDDMEASNPIDNSAKYWEKITTFSIASALIGLMNTLAFPTAHTGWHTSVYMLVYQSNQSHLAITTGTECLFRCLGSLVGCILAIAYERIITWIDTPHKTSKWATLIHIVLYCRPCCPS